MAAETDARASYPFTGGLFRVRLERQPSGALYEYVERVGAVIVLATTEVDFESHVITINNKGKDGGGQIELPGGNSGFRGTVSPAYTGLRELREETGYGYAPGDEPDISVLALKDGSRSIDYPRDLVVARNVQRLGEQQLDGDEDIEVLPPVSTRRLIREITHGETTLPAEVAVGFMIAKNELGYSGLIDWITKGEGEPQIFESFDPWLTPHN